MAKVQSKDDDERSGGGGGGGGGGRSGGGDGGCLRSGGGGGSSDDRGSLDDFLSYLSGASPLPPTTTSGSSSAPVFLPADVARVGKDDAAPSSDVEPIEPSAPPLSELDEEESRTMTYSTPSVVFATPIPPPFAPRNYAMASTTTAVDDYVIATPLASSATPMVAFPNRSSDPPEMAAFRDRQQPPSTGNEALDATTTFSAPTNQGGYEQRIREYKLGLVSLLISLGSLAAVAIIAAVVVVGVYRPDPPSAAPTNAPISSATNSSSSASPTAIPTSTPTASPTSTPTASTSEYPTTASPFEFPTTASPLEFPTTASPSEYPTTAIPTNAPTKPPITASPSESPLAASPVMIPTSAPVAFPSATWTWEQQGQSIVGAAEYDYFGHSVAMSADAKTLVVGAIGSNDNTGYVKVYHTNDDGSSSMQLLGQSILGYAVGDYFGHSVDISPDGKIVAIGSPGYYGNHDVNDPPGYVQVFFFESDDFGSSWKQLGQDITGDADGDRFGGSVSLSGDGKTLAVGANGNDGNGEDSGCVRIYHLEDNGTSWEQIGQDIYGEAAGDNSGWTVSLSADGATVAIGAPWNDGNGDSSGHVRVYQIDSTGSIWEQLGQDINGVAGNDYFGPSVDISPDGRTLAIGAPGNWNENDRPGYVRVYYLESNDLTSRWIQLGQDIIGERVGDWFGFSVSLSDDGKTLAIGACTNDGNGVDSGHVRVYRMDDSSTSWTDIDGEASYDLSGYAMFLSADGTTVAIGAPWNDDNGFESGHVRIFSIR